MFRGCDLGYVRFCRRVASRVSRLALPAERLLADHFVLTHRPKCLFRVTSPGGPNRCVYALRRSVLAWPLQQRAGSGDALGTRLDPLPDHVTSRPR